MGPSVLEKKLIKDGTWALRKEVPGWLFDGLERTIELPKKKCKEILADLKEVRRVNSSPAIMPLASGIVFWGPFFSEEYLPQKLDKLPPF
jgi:hypothetical protein